MECVPWPRVSSVIGSRMKRPFFTCLISSCIIGSSGGFTKSSAELMASSGAVIFDRCGAGL